MNSPQIDLLAALNEAVEYYKAHYRIQEPMAEPLQQRVNERKIYEEVVNLIVNYVNHEFTDDEPARLRVYSLIAENFEGMARVLRSPSTDKQGLMGIIENGETDE